MNSRPPITTHVLDLVKGKPATGIIVRLYAADQLIATGVTDDDGRVETWQTDFTIAIGKYRLEFKVGDWFSAQGESSFYDDVLIAFRVGETSEHYHVPLLLSPHGYSTYRGS